LLADRHANSFECSISILWGQLATALFWMAVVMCREAVKQVKMFRTMFLPSLLPSFPAATSSGDGLQL